MEYWTFASPDIWFTFTLPENWSEYDDGDDGTFAFFNTQKWSGNLRISSFRWEGVELGTDKAYNHIVSKIHNEPGAVLMQLAGYDTAYFTELSGDMMIKYWITGLNNSLLICSFSFDKDVLGTHYQVNELKIIEEMLSTIKINH